MKSFRKALSILLCAIIVMLSSFSGLLVFADEDPMSLRRESVPARNAAQAYTSITYSHDERFADGYDYINVIDVSKHNGTIDWAKVYADGVHEAIIRVGYRGNSEGGLFSDAMFETNIAGALAAGLKVGVYFYTQAITTAEAEEEAEFVINAIKGKNITLPVVYDCEYAESGSSYSGRLYDAKLANFYQTLICLAFLNKINAAGYQPMLYANKYMLSDKILVSSIESKYPIWLAEYKSSPSYTGSYTMWQYTPTGRVNGISGNVDMNFRYAKSSDTKKIEVSASKTEITVGETLQVSAKLNVDAIAAVGNAGSITWSSSAPGVATVDSTGLVKAVAAGSAEISASIIVTPSQGAARTFSDKIAVTVKSAGSVDPTEPTPTNPTPTNPTPTDPTPAEPVTEPATEPTTAPEETTSPYMDFNADGGLLSHVLTILTNAIIWCLNMLTKIMSMFVG